MYILGIETSCDETSASVVKDAHIVISNITSSSLKFHKKYGGIIPEIAARKQLEAITQVVDLALTEAKINLKDVSLISVVSEPGLIGSLVVGRCFAKALSFGINIPFIEVNHLLAHLYASFLGQRKIKLPFVGLVVSGGHTSLFYVKDFDRVELIGNTLDDACGETFDKVAKILKLGYPGGPIIEKLARKGSEQSIKFSLVKTKNPLDFSFSGIKTAVFYKIRSLANQQLNKKIIYDICASFQKIMIENLLKRAILACILKRTKTLVLGGGVVANQYLREKFQEEVTKNNIELLYPQREFCLDNAAMVAGLGGYLYKKNKEAKSVVR